MAAARRLRPADAPAARHDARRRDVAVLGDVDAGDRSDLHRARRRRRLRARRRRSTRSRTRRARRSRGRAASPTIRLRRRFAARSTRRSRSRSTRFLADEWEQLHAARGGARGLHRARALVARRLRAVSGAVAIDARRRPGATGRRRSRDRDPRALDEARRQLARDDPRSSSTGSGSPRRSGRTRGGRARARGVACSATCRSWRATTARRSGRAPTSFMLDVSAGVPPDAFSATGRTGACRPTDWDVDRAVRLRVDPAARAERMAALFDGVRVDHVVGLYRTYGRPAGRRAVLHAVRRSRAARAGRDDPRHSRVERARSDRRGPRHRSRLRARVAGASSAFRAARCCAGSATGTPPGQPFVDPAHVSGGVGGDDRHARHRAARGLVGRAARATNARVVLDAAGDRARQAPRRPDAPWTDRLRDAMLELAYRAGSDDLFLPIQDVFGWRDRINTPGTVSAAQLDLVPAVAGRSARDERRGARARGVSAAAGGGDGRGSAGLH